MGCFPPSKLAQEERSAFPQLTETVPVLGNFSNERQLLSVASGSFHSTECRCQFLQLKGTFVKKTKEDLKGESCSARDWTSGLPFQPAQQLCPERETSCRAPGPGPSPQPTAHACDSKSTCPTGLSFLAFQNTGCQKLGSTLLSQYILSRASSYLEELLQGT